VDLGLLHTTSKAVVDPLLERATSVALDGVSPETQAIVEAACEALRAVPVRAWVYRVTAEVSARGGHLTMRELWAFVAYLVTGGRAAQDRSPPRITDSVGARLFAYVDAPHFSDAIAACDPSFAPKPNLARAILRGQAATVLQGAIGVRPFQALETLSDADGAVDGVALARTAAVHMPETEVHTDSDVYGRLVTRLASQPAGWQAHYQTSAQVLAGVYRALDLWCAAGSFPGWQTLCYDSSRLPYDGPPRADVGAVASAMIEPSMLRVALPRAHPAGAPALEGAYRPPYVWLTFEGGDGRHPLRLTPRLFSALYLGNTTAIGTAERLTLERWLARAPQGAATGEVRVWRKPVQPRQKPLRVTHYELDEKTRLELEG
jgi:hypothetical protein